MVTLAAHTWDTPHAWDTSHVFHGRIKRKIIINTKLPSRNFDESTMVVDLIMVKIRFFYFVMTFSGPASSDDVRELS